MRLTLLTIISSLFLLSCSGTTNQFIIEDYSVDRQEISIAMMPIESDFHFNNYPDHVYGALRPQEQRVFNQDLAGILGEYTGANVSGLLSSSVQVNNEFEMREFTLDESTFEAITPKKGQPLRIEASQSRFVLIFDQYFFTPYTVEVGGDSYAGHESKTEERLRFETNYVIWDNELRDAVAWGKVNSTEQINFSNTRATYIDILNKAIEKIVAVSPFNGVDV
jgi:hypothetical protein